NHQIHDFGQRIDDRRADDTHVAAEIPVRIAGSVHIVVHGSDDVGAIERPKEVGLPVRGENGGIIGVECIHRIVDGADVEDIVGAFAGNRDVGHNQGLGVDLVVNG